jgi:CRISPR-associated protein Csb2
MIALQIQFVAGRFHANPWDRGANKGEVEWPPAPWRILQAIVAGWRRAEAADREMLLRVLEVLCEPPFFNLPRSMAGQSRHYVSLGGLKNGADERPQILDSFLRIEPEREHFAAAYVVWPNARFEPEERALLHRCCECIGDLGRAESCCAITVCDESSVTDWGEEGGDTIVRVDLASRSTGPGLVVSRLAAGPSLRGVGLFTSLCEPTGEMRRPRLLVPPGTVWVEYRLPPDYLFVKEQHRAQESVAPTFAPIMLRFALECSERGALPPVTHALTFAESMRRATFDRFSRLHGRPASQYLVGNRENGGKPEGHEHPYFLPSDSRADGKIDRIDVWFPKGCRSDEYRAVASMVQLRVPHDMRHKLPREIAEIEMTLTFLGKAPKPSGMLWRTVTPVVLDRFPKWRGEKRTQLIDAPEEQIRAMLRRVTAADAEIEVESELARIRRGTADSEHDGVRVDAFKRSRKGETTPPPIAVTLRFDRAVEGPIVLGRLAHFGLGQFEAVG